MASKIMADGSGTPARPRPGDGHFIGDAGKEFFGNSAYSATSRVVYVYFRGEDGHVRPLLTTEIVGSPSSVAHERAKPELVRSTSSPATTASLLKRPRVLPICKHNEGNESTTATGVATKSRAGNAGRGPHGDPAGWSGPAATGR